MVNTLVAGFYSGAGFSNIFSTPSYQTLAVAAYELALGSTDSGDYNKGGRAFPDVTAQGSLQNVVASGSTELGESFSPLHCARPLSNRTMNSWWNLCLGTHLRLRPHPP